MGCGKKCCFLAIFTILLWQNFLSTIQQFQYTSDIIRSELHLEASALAAAAAASLPIKFYKQ